MASASAASAVVTSTISKGFAYTITSLAGSFGRLWKPGHESLIGQRRIVRVQGMGATDYLQGLVTCDLTQPPVPPREEEEEHVTAGEPSSSTTLVEFSDKLRAVCFLDNKGRIVTDALLWKVDATHYYIDVPEDTADTLLGHLKPFILRRTKVKVQDVSETMGAASHVVLGTMNARGSPEGYLSAVDPRHPSLGVRILSLSETTTQQFGPMMQKGSFPEAPGTYNVVRKLAGVAEGSELQAKIAGETNQEFLNAVSFSKGKWGTRDNGEDCVITRRLSHDYFPMYICFESSLFLYELVSKKDVTWGKS